jgi:histidinol dehydrogenase/sulfopropanediol 3-dehydrogenase
MIIKAGNWRRSQLNTDPEITNKVSEIIQQIRLQGDDAIDEYSKCFDQQLPKAIKLEPFEEYQLDDGLKSSIKFAAQRIEKFAQFQMQGIKSSNYTDEYGSFGQIVSPIERVGAYIPGGRYPLISSALMTLIPARIAGCKTRIACSPSDNPAILAAASLAGATDFIQLGGVQAIAAMALGYQNVAPVDIIVGPGNAWVNEAKKQLQSIVKIDGLAGPSEMLAICDNQQPIEWLALDALAQAEHDPLACSILISDDLDWLTQMLGFLEKNPETKALITNKQIELVLAESTQEIIEFSEAYAPEHLMLCHKQIDSTSVCNFGAIFIGVNSAVALGDYISGPNHTLPTLGNARKTGGLNVFDFLRIKTTQKISQNGRRELSRLAMPLAEAEGLNAHYLSMQVRS